MVAPADEELDEQVEELAAETWAKLIALSSDQRVGFLIELRDYYCPSCGRAYRENDSYCRCWDDS